MRLERASDGDRQRIRDLLEANGLPHEGLGTSPVDRFVGAVDGRFVGAVGLERYGEEALLRSLVVPGAVRGRGHGTGLYRAIESAAREAGVTRLHLLTASAAPFFLKLGFEPIDRSHAPETIRGTAEFRELCSDDATCLRKRLG